MKFEFLLKKESTLSGFNQAHLTDVGGISYSH